MLAFSGKVWVAPETASPLFYYTKVTEFHLQCIHLPHKTLVTEFDWNLDLHMHQKLSHFGRLRFCLGGLMVWVAPETARTLFYYTKATEHHFRWHIESLIGQIWPYQISQNCVWDFQWHFILYRFEFDPQVFVIWGEKLDETTKSRFHSFYAT